jgi:hypothetical protein
MLHLSRHAERRCQQRGITNERLATFLDNADIDQPIGSNCHLRKVSRNVWRAIPGGEWLASMVVIEADDTGEVVTVMHTARGRRGRRYRKAA